MALDSISLDFKTGILNLRRDKNPCYSWEVKGVKRDKLVSMVGMSKNNTRCLVEWNTIQNEHEQGIGNQNAET